MCSGDHQASVPAGLNLVSRKKTTPTQGRGNFLPTHALDGSILETQTSEAGFLLSVIAD
jgi:hypothetical protein